MPTTENRFPNSHMLRTILIAVGILGLPSVVLVCEGTLMMEVSGMNPFLRQYESEIPRSLAQRRLGYSEAEAREYWTALERRPGGLMAQKRFLQIDLLFALLLAAAIAFSTISGWAELGRPWNLFVFLVPVLLYLLADWLETSLHLRAVSMMVEAGSNVPIDDGTIRLSSYATIAKWWSVIPAALLLIGITIAIFVRHFKTT